MCEKVRWMRKSEEKRLTVGKDVGRELQHVREDLVEHHRLFFQRGRIELGLNVARAKLVATELDNVAGEVLR